jgi:hypothetical protein
MAVTFPDRPDPDALEQQAEQDFSANFNQWSTRAARVADDLAAPRMMKDFGRLEAPLIRMLSELASLCEGFIDRTLLAWGLRLQRDGRPVNYIAEQLPKLTERVLSETYKRKWKAGLGVLGTTGSVLGWPDDELWAQTVEKDVSHLIEDFPRRLTDPRLASLSAPNNVDAARRYQKAIEASARGRAKATANRRSERAGILAEIDALRAKHPEWPMTRIARSYLREQDPNLMGDAMKRAVDALTKRINRNKKKPRTVLTTVPTSFD